MTGFTIDDVRSTMPGEVVASLARIEATASDLLRQPSLAWVAGQDASGALLAAIEHQGHAIYGTSSLVSAGTLASCAQMLERLAEQGRADLRDAQERVRRVRRVVALLAAGASETRAVLDLELRHEGDEAQWVCAEWLARAEAVLAEPLAPRGEVDGEAVSDDERPTNPRPAAAAAQEAAVAEEPIEVVEEFSFQVEEEQVRAGSGADPGEFSFDDLLDEAAPKANPHLLNELKEVFHQEAREAVIALQGHLGVLLSDPGNATLAAPLERVYHTLKGAAATVGLMEVSEQAASLQHRMEAALVRQDAVDADWLQGLVRDTNKMLAAAGLDNVAIAPPIASVSTAPMGPARRSEAEQAVRRAFGLDAQATYSEASGLVAQLDAVSDASQMSALLGHLARIFHRLKGSAAVAGAEDIAEAAATLERSCLATPAPTTAALSQGLARIAAKLGLAHVSPERGPRSPQPEPVAQLGERAASAPTRREAVEQPAEELWETFTVECAELMDAIERGALALEESASPKAELSTLMRLVHTLKGVVNTTGLAPTGRTLHRVEDFLELLLSAPILPPARSVASLILEVHSQVHKNLKEARSGWVETSPERLNRHIAAVMGGHHEGSTESTRFDSARAASGGQPASVRTEPPSDVSGADAPERRVIRVSTDRLDTLMNLAGELVVNRSRLTSRVERLRLLQSELGRGSRRLVETVDAFCEEHEFANLDGHRAPLPEGIAAMTRRATDDVGGAAAAAWTGFGELELDRYEGIHVLTRSLTELTSDFADLQAELARGLAGLTDDSDVVGGIVTGIQTEVTRARMVPLETLFLRLRLPLRDAAIRERKEVRVVVRGDDVPVDKTIADALLQPMLHLVRNAVVHGIEGASRRAASGKDSTGLVELSARQESGQIVIEVRDDGAGLDLTALRARGIAMGVLPADVPASDSRVKEMVFVSGLSTHGAAGDVAGRGVGCDVVKRAVDRLNGSIRVDTTAGGGTAFVISLPLTLAITRALVVRHAEQSFAIPLHFAERIIDAHEQQVVIAAGVRRIKVDEAFMPVRTLGDFCGVAANGAVEGPVLLLHVGDKRMALQVEAISAHEEVVVKSLGTLLTGHPTFAGVTVRGTGELVLIVDVPSLVEAKGATTTRAVAASAPVRAAVSATRAAVRDPERRPASAALRVLFVDDSLSVRKVAEIHLKGLGVDVTMAVDGVDALAKLREGRFDLVFTDLEMPRMHGFELIRELRFVPAYKDLPIVVVTSRSGQKHQDQARELGANEYLTKPFNAQTLEAALKKWAHAKAPALAAVRSIEGAP